MTENESTFGEFVDGVVDSFKTEEEVDAKVDQLLVAYSKQAVREALDGYRTHKLVIVALILSSILVWIASLGVILVGLFTWTFEVVVMSFAVYALALMLLAAGFIGIYLLYQRLVGMVSGKAVQLIKDVLVYTFGLNEDSRLMRFLVNRVAGRVFKDMKIDARY